jgi:1-phosphofructokinase family hexose kinase
MAFGFVAGEVGHIVERTLTAEGIPHHFLHVPGQTRVNFTVVDGRGTATSFYAAGPEVALDSAAALHALVRFWLQGRTVLVLAGSLPEGLPAGTYAAYLKAARDAGVRTILDADGPALAAGLAAHPDLVKPNVQEAARLLGRPLTDLRDIVRAAREIVGLGARTAVVSMAEQGAVCASGGRVWRILPVEVERRSTVGSGDAMVAGLAVSMARGEPLEDGLRLGTAAGAASAMSEGTTMGSAEDVAKLLSRVRVEPIA